MDFPDSISVLVTIFWDSPVLPRDPCTYRHQFRLVLFAPALATTVHDSLIDFHSLINQSLMLFSFPVATGFCS